MIHSYTFQHKTSRHNHTQTIGHNCFPRLLYTSSCAAYPCIRKQSHVFVDGSALHCGIGPLPCGNGKTESKTTATVCKVFVHAIVSKRLPMVQGPHLVIISVSQGYGFVTILQTIKFLFFKPFSLNILFDGTDAPTTEM